MPEGAVDSRTPIGYKLAMPTFAGRFLRIAAPLLLLTCVAGCSTSGYEKQWRAASIAPAGDKALEGRWEGLWLSEVNGHTGRLRCIITHAHGKNYRFDFNSTFWKMFRYRTTLTFRLEDSAGTLKFTGSEDLGPVAGGVYTYEGGFNGSDFQATFKSAYDHGVFKMHKVD